MCKKKKKKKKKKRKRKRKEKKRKKLDHQLIPYTEISSRWIKDLNLSRDTIKVLEENIGKKISDIPCSNIFTVMSPTARDIKERINKWDFIMFDFYCQSLKPLNFLPLLSLFPTTNL